MEGRLRRLRVVGNSQPCHEKTRNSQRFGSLALAKPLCRSASQGPPVFIQGWSVYPTESMLDDALGFSINRRIQTDPKGTM